jgi:hypothetical protein
MLRPEIDGEVADIGFGGRRRHCLTAVLSRDTRKVNR